MIAELSIPARMPDIDEQTNEQYAARVWQPTPEQSGILVTTLPESTDRLENIKSLKPTLCRDLVRAGRVFTEPSGLQPLYNYLGVYYEQAQEGDSVTRKASFLHVETVNERLAALAVSAEHRPPQLTAWDGGDFPARVGLDHFIATGNFLAATQDKYAPHDMLVHFVVAQVFMRPNDIDRLVSLAKQKKCGSDYDIEIFMAHLDAYLSTEGVGGNVSKALAQEYYLEGEETQAQANELKRNVDDAWRLAGTRYAELLESEEDYIDPEGLREHCLMLSSAALRQLKIRYF